MQFGRHLAPFLRSTVRCRYYSEANAPAKVPAKLIGELRRHTEVPITKAREALTATGNDVEKALQWIQEDLVKSGAAKAEKLSSRTAGEGVLAVSVLSEGWGKNQGAVRAAIIELNCETDFVSRSESFNSLAARIAYTAAYMAESPSVRTKSDPEGSFFQHFPLSELNDAPLLSKSQITHSRTVQTAVKESIAVVGEKIAVRRVLTFVSDPLSLPNAGLRVGAYVHDGGHKPEEASVGRIASLVAVGIISPKLPELRRSDDFVSSLSKLSRSLARQVVGHNTETIHPTEGQRGPASPESTALYTQPFMGFSEDKGVHAVLRSWAEEKGMGDEQGTGVEVLEFAKWTVGEGIERPVVDFAAEVAKLAKPKVEWGAGEPLPQALHIE